MRGDHAQPYASLLAKERAQDKYSPLKGQTWIHRDPMRTMLDSIQASRCATWQTYPPHKKSDEYER